MEEERVVLEEGRTRLAARSDGGGTCRSDVADCNKAR